MINIITLRNHEDTMDLVKILNCAGYVTWIERTKESYSTIYHVCYKEQEEI